MTYPDETDRKNTTVKKGCGGMGRKIERESAWYGDICERIEGRDDWLLYLCDHYWILDIDGDMEFYFNPTHFLGKVEKVDLPESVIQKIKQECICFDKEHLNPYCETKALQSSWLNMELLDEALTIGNWFYAQGYTYVTCNGRFYREISPYNMHQECAFSDIGADIVCDMLRMTASTRTHRYIKSIYDLKCFRSVDRSKIPLKPSDGFCWDSTQWKDTFESISNNLKSCPNSDSYRAEMRAHRKKVYMHTLFVSQKGYYYTEKGDTVKLPDSGEMIRNSRFYSTKQTPPLGKEYEDAVITVENTDCLIAAKNMLDEGYNPAVLNMANRQKPGGGVYNGAGAQEENLFRRTNLFKSLYQYSDLAYLYGIPKAAEAYPMDRNHGGIYSPDVVVFRGAEKDGYPILDEYYQVAFISVAGMNRPELDSQGRIAARLVEGIKNKIRTILNIALDNGHDSLVMGALGCGAFRNPPDHTAQLFREVIETEYKNRFRKICFAILEDHNSVRKNSTDGNYIPFCREFGIIPQDTVQEM